MSQVAGEEPAQKVPETASVNINPPAKMVAPEITVLRVQALREGEHVFSHGVLFHNFGLGFVFHTYSTIFSQILVPKDCTVIV